MKISAKIDYACRALLELSLHWPNTTPLPLSVIVDRQKIPTKFLTQILLSLKQMGYIQSMRGKSGGYLLAKAPKEITLKDLYLQIDRNELEMHESRKYTKENQAMKLVWEELNAKLLENLEKVNFELIINRKRCADNLISFEI